MCVCVCVGAGTWGYLGVPGGTWGYLGVPGGTWGYLGVPGGLGEEGCVQRRASVARPDATLLTLL